MGYCLGGALTIIAAANVPEVDMAVCYYGIPPVDAVDPSSISIPFQGHFATRDDWCTPAAVDGLETALNNGKVDYELHRHEAAHGFFNEAEPAAYDQECAALSWERTMSFLTQHFPG